MLDDGAFRYRVRESSARPTACFDCAVDYAKHRVQFAGKPIAAHQLVQAKFAEMLTQITSSQLMVARGRASQRSETNAGRST